MTGIPAQIVHDAEIHRQHVRLKIPLTIEIDGTRYTVDDWSMGGFGVVSEMTSRQVGERLPARIFLPFEDFEIALHVDCQLVYIAEDNSRFGCRFAELGAGQVDLFRRLIDAYLTGELVSAGDVMAVAGRTGTGEARAKPLSYNPYLEEENFGRRLRRVAGLTLLGILTLGLAALVALGARDRWLTVRAESAVIEAPMFRVRAPISGTFDAAHVDAIVKSGAPLGKIQPVGGGAVGLTSPCECVVLDWRIASGQVVLMGEPVAVLVAADEPLVVRAQVAFRAAQRLKPGDVAEVAIPGRPQAVLGQVESVDFKPQRLALSPGLRELPVEPRLAQVVIRPDRPFDFDDLGSLVSVRFP